MGALSMDYQKLIDGMSPEIYKQLSKAVELGKWPDGRPVSPEQRETCMQAIIAWGEKHLPAKQRVGFIDKGHKEGDSCDDPAETPLTWKD
jgi:uncharacterized protein